MSRLMTDKQLAEVGDVIRSVMDHVAAQGAKIQDLEASVRRYGNHTMYCQLRDYSLEMETDPPDPVCTCGFVRYESSSSGAGK